MIKQTIVIAVETNKQGIVTRVGGSPIITPPITFDKSKGGIKWFDDSKLIRKQDD